LFHNSFDEGAGKSFHHGSSLLDMTRLANLAQYK